MTGMPMSAFGRDSDIQIRAILPLIRRPELATDDSGYSRLSPRAAVQIISGWSLSHSISDVEALAQISQGTEILALLHLP